MLKILAEQWCKNKNQLKQYLQNHYDTLNSLTYKDIAEFDY